MPTSLSSRITGSRLSLFFSIERHDRFERCILGDGHRICGHDFGDPAAVLVNEVGCRLTRAENEIQQSAALALGADFAAADEIAFRDDADQFSGGIDDGKPADMPLQHECLRLRGWWLPARP